ncbi:MAG: hypothetical protein ACFFAO_03555 [Candidatus Hermodarchaeota archaeon]
MNSIKTIEKIRQFLNQDFQPKREIHCFTIKSNQIGYFNKLDIKVDIDKYKEIILKEETVLELGGENRNSFSLVYPISNFNIVQDGKIILIGPEVSEISERILDFGLFILIGYKQLSIEDVNILREYNFISNGIEGFMIRTIPRRFWCRISKVIKDKFSFEFLGNAIYYLYKQKFEKTIKSIEIIFIVAYPDLIEEFKELTSDIRNQIEKNWKEKVDKWKKRIDCDYEWDCNECPYYETCEDIKDVLIERNKIRE